MKLEAKDLRIGNLVMDNAKVKIVTSGMISNWDIIKRDYAGYEPIPITEEWLLKLGFLLEYDEGDIKYYVKSTNHNFGIKGYDNSEWYIYHEYPFSDDYTILKELAWVHELQNVWFSLTDEELTLNETR